MIWPTPASYRTALILVLLLLVGSLRAVFKYLPWPGWIALGMLTGGLTAYAFLMARVKSNGMGEHFPFRYPKTLCVLLLILFATASYEVYPLADARRLWGAGSTADDGLIQTAGDFFSSGSMYDRPLAGGIPISAGPGWALLNLPLANSHSYWAMGPLYILIAVLIHARLAGTALPEAVVLCLLASSPLFWELLVTGHDIVPLGFALAALVMAGWKIAQDRTDGGFLPLLFGALMGAVATSRVVFAPLPLMMALLAWKQNRKFALLAGSVGLICCAALHGYFFWTSERYQPLHLFLRGNRSVGGDLIGLGLIGETIAVVWVFLRTDNRLGSWLFGAWLCLAIPLGLIALGELRAVGGQFSLWEGANYIFPCVPCYLFFAAETRQGGATSIFRPKNG